MDSFLLNTFKHDLPDGDDVFNPARVDGVRHNVVIPAGDATPHHRTLATTKSVAAGILGADAVSTWG